MVQQCRLCGQMHDVYTGCTLGASGDTTTGGNDEALVGSVVADRYTIAGVIGVGSTGTVHGVEHVTFARAAAMKVLRPTFATPELVSRVFHGEARAAWSVSHPCLCEVFDIGTLPDGAPFFVMERLEGETLATRIARERLSLAAAVDVMMQLLSAIAAIHARDLLLRDLRPQNIYLVHRRGCRPVLKILDFGLARLVPLDRLQENWEALRATMPEPRAAAIPFYLSPERARGEHGVEPASDLFVAAMIFYETLAGERAFRARSWKELVSTIAHGKRAALHERRSDVSPELSAFVSRCLSPNPRLRPPSAKDMQDELREIIEGGRRGAASMIVSMTTIAPARDGAASPISPIAAASPPPTHRPPSGSYERDAASDDITYEDDTETHRDALGNAALEGVRDDHRRIPRLVESEPEDELSTAARRVDPALLRADGAPVDEASAENADRTVPPPPSIDITFDDSTERTIDLRGYVDAHAPLGSTAPKDEEDETETMELTPELRARVDQLMATKPAPVPVDRRPTAATKPPRRR